MKKIIIIIILIFSALFSTIKLYATESDNSQNIENNREICGIDAQIIYLTNEIEDDYILSFDYKDENCFFSLLDYKFITKNIEKKHASADISTEYSLDRYFSVIKLSYINVDVNVFTVEAYIYFPSKNDIVCAYALTDYILPEILNYEEGENINLLLSESEMIFSSVMNIYKTNGIAPVANEDNTIDAIHSDNPLLSSSEIALSYLPLSVEGNYYDCDDKIVHIIPKDYFYTKSTYVEYGEELGYYLTVTSGAEGVKICKVDIFKINVEKPDNQHNIVVEFIPLFQQQYYALEYSDITKKYYPQLYGNGNTGRYVISPNITPPNHSFSNMITHINLSNLDAPNYDDSEYSIDEDDNLRISSATYGVKYYRNSHVVVNDSINGSTTVFLKKLTGLISKYSNGNLGKASKVVNLILEHADLFMNSSDTPRPFSDKLYTTTFDTSNDNGLLTEYIRDLALFLSPNDDKNVYIGEMWDSEIIDEMERFYSLYNLVGSGDQHATVTFGVDINQRGNNGLQTVYDKLSTICFQFDLYYSLSSDDKYSGEIQNLNKIIPNNSNELISFIPNSSGIYKLTLNSSSYVSCKIFNSSYEQVYNGYVASYKPDIVFNLLSNKIYYILFEGTANSILNFSITKFNGDIYTLSTNSLSNTLGQNAYMICSLTPDDVYNYIIQTSGYADTTLTIYDGDNQIAYNDDYFHGSSGDEDTNMNAYLEILLKKKQYTVIIYNNGFEENITLYCYKYKYHNHI